MSNKTLKIDIPEGYEIDKDKSTFENIVFKKIQEKLPDWDDSIVVYRTDKNQIEKFLNLHIRLLWLRDQYRNGWKPNFKDGFLKRTIGLKDNNLDIYTTYGIQDIFVFQTKELAELFKNNFKNQLEEYFNYLL